MMTDDSGSEHSHSSLGDANSTGMNPVEMYSEYLDRFRKADFTLPETARILNKECGCKVYLIGTAHFSEKSIKDVEEVIENTCPDSVAVELCRRRAPMLQMTEDDLMNAGKDYNVKGSFKQYGTSGGIMSVLLSRLNRYAIEQFGAPPGVEFRAAFRKARSLPYQPAIILADRPIDITLKRAIASLGLFARFKFLYHLLTGLKPITKEEMEELKNSDMLEKVMIELAKEFPEITQVLVNERDMFLTRTLWNASMCVDADSCLHSVGVAVVGIGHCNGIEKLWSTAESIKLEDLCVIPIPPLSWRVFTRTAKTTVIAFLCYATWRTAAWFFPSLHNWTDYIPFI